MQLIELGDGTNINTAAIEGVAVYHTEETGALWEVVVLTAGDRYVDRRYPTAELAMQHKARLVAELSGIYTCSGCATPITATDDGTYVHQLRLAERDGCNDPVPAELADQWDLTEIGDLDP